MLLLGPCCPLRSIVCIDLKSTNVSSTLYPRLVSEYSEEYILFDMHGDRSTLLARYIMPCFFLAEESFGGGREEEAERVLEYYLSLPQIQELLSR